MPESSQSRKPSADPVLAAIIREVSPAGLIVSLPDGSAGVVRERELAWDVETRRNWEKLYKPDDPVQVVMLGKSREGRPELSIRLAQIDSWTNIEKRYSVGGMVDGVVTGIMPYGVFVELEAGVTGLVHASRFPGWTQRPLGEVFWPGDQVKVVVDTVDSGHQRIALSMTDLAGRRWRGAATATELSSSSQVIYGKSKQLHPALETLFSRAPMSVLVVEDDPEQRGAVVDWLRNAGQKAEAVASVEEALDLIFSARPDLVLMDIGLPGMNGIQGAYEVRLRWPEMRCVLMTDWSRAEHYATELQQLREDGVALLIKPLLPEDLLGVLLEVPTNLVLPSAQLSPTRSTLEQTSPTLGRVERSELIDVLSRLRSATRADKIVAFELETDSRQIGVLEQRGAPVLHPDALPELIHSPVRDAAEDEQIIVAKDALEVAGRRFLHLAPLLDFEACLGIPIPARLRNRYALFLFFARPTSITDTVSARAEAAAVAVGAWLERRQFIKQTADIHRIALLGQLGRALVHEISGRLTPINLALEKLQAGCDRVERYAVDDPATVVEEAQRARLELQNLAQQAQALAKTTRSFGRMTRPGQDEILRLDDLVGEAVAILSDAAATAHVVVVAQPAPRLFFTRAQVTFLQQVVVNVLQNAIQQIAQVRPQKGGRVEIRLTQAAKDGQQMLRVSVEDDGPGIHRRLWERVFEMDYTTRPDGSGLGLYMSRSLIESLGGRIYVAASYVLWGTTFVVELPYRI